MFVLIISLSFTLSALAQDSISGIDRKTKVSRIYKMLQGNWVLVSDTNNKLSFKGRNAISIYSNPYRKIHDTENCKYVVLFYDTTNYIESVGGASRSPHKKHDYPGRESDYLLINCDLAIPPSNSYFIFGCCVFKSIYSISKKYLRLATVNDRMIIYKRR